MSADSPYEVQDVINTLTAQIGQASLRAALSDAQLVKAEQRIAELENQLEQAMATLTELAPAQPMVIEPEEAKPRTRRST